MRLICQGCNNRQRGLILSLEFMYFFPSIQCKSTSIYVTCSRLQRLCFVMFPKMPFKFFHLYCTAHNGGVLELSLPFVLTRDSFSGQVLPISSASLFTFVLFYAAFYSSSPLSSLLCLIPFILTVPLQLLHRSAPHPLPLAGPTKPSISSDCVPSDERPCG